MQVKRLFVTITILFSLLLPNFSQAQRQQPGVVSIPDANLAAAIRQEIGNAITTDTILNLTRLDAPNRGITDLTGLEHARNLRQLNLGDEYIDGEEINSNAVSDPSPIAGLTRLTRLNLSYCGISDASFVSGLIQLTWLNLGNNTISDVSPLANLRQLNQLYLWSNTISDVSPLAELKKLTWLMLDGNNISDISPLAELKQLPGLGLGSNNISDISPLAELKKLTDLFLWRNTISDISALAELKKLTQLWLSNNIISDIAPLVELNLTGTEWDRTGLDIRSNPLSYASINTHIPAMQTRGIEVEFDARTPTTLVKISGTGQQGITNTALPLPFVVEVRDQQKQNKAFAGVPVTFSVATGGGTLSVTTTKTNTTGKATARLTMGQTAGTTTVRVTAADVSQPVEFTATAILRSSPVPIPDAKLRAKIAEILRKPLAGTITVTDMLKLRTLTANNAGILDLTGLQYASNLTSLSLNNNRISNVAPLAGLTQLTTLDLRGNWILDVSSLVGLTQLRGSNNQHGLSLQGNPLSDTAVRTHIPQLQAAGVNVGFDEISTHERPIVRLIYFRPRDRQPLPDVNTQLDRLIKDIQQFYADQMESHGFDRKTFQFETDAQGNAVVYHVIGKLEDTAYHDEARIIWDEIHEHLDRSKYIYLTALDVSSERIGTGEGDTACGVGGGSSSFNKYKGTALLPAFGGCFNFEVAAHELGHAFGLPHDFRSDAYIMSYGFSPNILSQCAAEWLDVHSAFNSNQPASTAAATIEMLPPSLASPPNAIRLRFNVTDPDGLHQVQLLTPTLSGSAKGFQELIACKHLNGTSSTVEFVISKTIFRYGGEVAFQGGEVALQVMDQQGDFSAKRFYADPQAGPKIEGPWLWVITPTGGRSGAGAAASGIDFLSEMSDGAVTESKIATEGATAGSPVGTSVWTLHTLSPTDSDNINDMAKAAGLGSGDIDNHVAYGSIALEASREQQTIMHVGSDDAVKVWLNGELVHDNPVNRGATGFQENFPVTLKAGKNILLVAVYEKQGAWSAFFGFAAEAAYTLPQSAPEIEPQAGPKIEGPWLWVITPTDGRSGASAAASGIDFLSEMSDGAVTESKIATEGATTGYPVGDSVWTLHTLSPTRSDNINDMAKAAGLGIGDIDYHVAYGSIALDAPREQQTIMHAGSDDAVKVWLNGELVHNNPVNRGASDFQDQFPVMLKKGTNILLVAVYEGWGAWTGFFGFAADAEYTLILPSSPRPAWDVNEDGIVDAKDVILVAEALGQEEPENPRLDVNGDGVVDGKDLILIAEHLGEGDAPAAPSHPARPLGFTLESVERTLNILRAADDGTLAFKRGIANLERILALFMPENTALLHNYPNPFNPETWIPYQLAEPAEVTLYIYAVNGALVRTLALGYQPAGVYRIRSRAAYWDGRNAQGERVASSVYFYTLTTGDFTATRKMLIRK